MSLQSAWYRYAEADLEHAVLIPDHSRWGQVTALHNSTQKFILANQYKQEWIPVGCVPPAVVATIRCQYQGVYLLGAYLSGGVPFRVGDIPVPPEGTWDQAYLPTPERNLGPGIPIPPQKGPGTRYNHPQKGSGTSHTHPCPMDRTTDT